MPLTNLRTTGAASAPERHALDVLEFGLVPYPEAIELQRRLADERAQGDRGDTLILLEHPPVVTRGRGTNGHTLRRTPHPVFDVERGGDVTYHGPGQLVGYPIVHLKERGLTIGGYLRLLEDILIDAVEPFGIRASREPGFTGAWAGPGPGEGTPAHIFRPASGKLKLASIGIAVRSWVAFHGFALNVATDLSQFEGLYPCGLEPERMTSMAELLSFSPDMAKVRGEIIRAFRKRFHA